MVEISVIIPVHNTEKYLRECIESVLSQTFENLEVICINDGSTDNSLQIIRQYATNDSRIKIINQKNQGVSAARNAGLEIARGKYVGFVDGDDTVEKDFFEKLFKKADPSEPDAVYSKLSATNDFIGFVDLIDRQEILKSLLPMFFRHDEYNSVCTKLFRVEMISEHKIGFPVGTEHGEDAQFNIEFIMKARRISFLDYCGYHYRQVGGSATRNIIKHDYLQRIVEVYKTDWTSIIGNKIDPKRLENLKRIRLANSVISLVYIYGNRGNDFTDAQRFSKLREIVQHPTIKNVFSDSQILAELELERYPKAIFINIRKRNVFLLYLLTNYTYYRNP